MKKILITGGAGFIGINAAEYFIKKGYKVVLFDNLIRAGTEYNLVSLRENYKNFIFIKGDVTDFKKLLEAFGSEKKWEAVLHLAGQVAVTKSIADPRADMEANLIGTINVLEAVRNKYPETIVLYASTNKVYGELENCEIVELETRYDYKDMAGISEKQCLSFCSPYACSKGAGDQYVRDYAKMYNLRTVVFRQSCIYGKKQMGVEDQGWVSWLLMALRMGKKIKIYGDGKQTRDLLYIDDLIRAYDLALVNISKVSGNVYNIGGGRKNSISVWKEFEPLLSEVIGEKPSCKYEKERMGDQKVYISDIRKIESDLGWEPRISVAHGVDLLNRWIGDYFDTLSSLYKNI